MLNDLLCADPRPLEIKWYRKNGRFKERITKDGNGNEYVIGDYSWNTFKNKNKLEHIELDMNFAIRNSDILST